MFTPDFPHVLRYVITHMGPQGQRRMTAHRQGRYTYATEEEAKIALQNFCKNNYDSTLIQVFGKTALGTFEVRPCPCYPGHFDPICETFE